MKTSSLQIIVSIVAFLGFGRCAAQTPASEFDENAIRAIQDSLIPSQEFQTLILAFEASSNSVAKAAKWEQLVISASEGLLSSLWSEPANGWRLIEFPAAGNLTLEDARNQPWNRAFYTKLVAQNPPQAVHLRGAGALMKVAANDGEQWANDMLLDVVQRPDSNFKRLTYWFTSGFGQDAEVINWSVDWNAWQQAYNAANALGKAIILKNVTMLALKRNELTVAGAINLSALSGGDRELKAIAIAFGDPALGSEVTAKWAEIASDPSDPQIQALARELRKKWGLSD